MRLRSVALSCADSSAASDFSRLYRPANIHNEWLEAIASDYYIELPQSQIYPSAAWKLARSASAGMHQPWCTLSSLCCDGDCRSLQNLASRFVDPKCCPAGTPSMRQSPLSPVQKQITSARAGACGSENSINFQYLFRHRQCIQSFFRSSISFRTPP